MPCCIKSGQQHLAAGRENFIFFLCPLDGEQFTFEFGVENNDHNNMDINSLIKWFYELELIACEVPEVVYGAENYIFEVNGKDAFTYEDRGKKAYIIISGDYYKVNNPSTPPIK